MLGARIDQCCRVRRGAARRAHQQRCLPVSLQVLDYWRTPSLPRHPFPNSSGACTPCSATDTYRDTRTEVQGRPPQARRIGDLGIHLLQERSWGERP